MNIDYKNETKKAMYWTTHHRSWLGSRIKELESQNSLKINLQCLISTLNQLEGTIRQFELEIEKLSQLEKYRKKIKSLIAYRGIKTLIAMTIVTEIWDVNRFPHPKRLVSYLGLDIIEYSSGGKEKRHGITKMGNRQVRTALVEANQSASRSPEVSRYLAQRRKGINHSLLQLE